MFCALSHVVDVSPCLGLQGVYLVPYQDIQMAICVDFLHSANVWEKAILAMARTSSDKQLTHY
jgi:hypothetical protein